MTRSKESCWAFFRRDLKRRGRSSNSVTLILLARWETAVHLGSLTLPANFFFLEILYHFIPISMANIKNKNKKIENNVSAWMWKNWHPVCCWWECKIVQLLCKTVWWFLKELETELQYDPAIPLKDIYSKWLKAGTGRDMSINGWVDKQNIIQP